MAISSTIVWRVQATATAANANGGGFKPGASGTDYSQQNAAQYNLTGMTTAGVTAILLTASASADMVGNIAHIISGTNFTVGWYEITSVSPGVSITLDRNCASGIGALGAVNIGGAISLGSSTTNQTDTNWAAVPISGNTIYLTGSVTFAATFTVATGVSLIGIQTQAYSDSGTKHLGPERMG